MCKNLHQLNQKNTLDIKLLVIPQVLKKINTGILKKDEINIPLEKCKQVLVNLDLDKTSNCFWQNKVTNYKEYFK